jgi:hypothetical protein
MEIHIDPEALTGLTEGDIEQRVVLPLLTGAAYLNLPEANVYSKQYLAPTVLDKNAGKTGGYYPDFSFWRHGFAVLIVEVKSPEITAETGYREASLYARHINQQYPTGLNPTRHLIATNGKELLFGYHDAAPIMSVKLTDLSPGTFALNTLQRTCGIRALEAFARACLTSVRGERAARPSNLVGGQALLNAKKPLNTFAAELSPVLRRYFGSANQENVREIAERAYVNSAEITEYDRVLEALLKDRLSVRRDTIVQQLAPGRHGEPNISKALTEFRTQRPGQGQLQIIQGGVGTGKSLFIRRYKELLQPKEQAKSTYWAFIDFNPSPTDLSAAERWLCTAFVESFGRENPAFDLTSNDSLRRVFSRHLQRRKGVYDEIAKVSRVEAGGCPAAC